MIYWLYHEAGDSHTIIKHQFFSNVLIPPILRWIDPRFSHLRFLSAVLIVALLFASDHVRAQHGTAESTGSRPGGASDSQPAIGITECDQYSNMVRCFMRTQSPTLRAWHQRSFERKLKRWKLHRHHLGDQRIRQECLRGIKMVRRSILTFASSRHCINATATFIPNRPTPRQPGVIKLSSISKCRHYSNLVKCYIEVLPPVDRANQERDFQRWLRLNRYFLRKGSHLRVQRSCRSGIEKISRIISLNPSAFHCLKATADYNPASPHSTSSSNALKSPVAPPRQKRSSSKTPSPSQETWHSEACKPGSTIPPSDRSCPFGTQLFQLKRNNRSFYCAKKNRHGRWIKHGPFGNWLGSHYESHDHQKGYFCNDKKHGRWKDIGGGYETKTLQTYRNGVLHGKSTSKQGYEHYVNGQKHGLSVEYGPYNNKNCFYVKGLLDSCSLPFKSQTRTASCPSGTSPVGATPPESVSLWCETGSGVKKGPYITWYKNGVLNEDGHFSHGKRHGKFRGWTKNGMLRYKGSYQRGQRHGHWIEWQVDEWGPVKKSEGDYRNGNRFGHWITWHPNGAIREEGNYRYGKRTGRWTSWHPNAVKASEGAYSNGLATGQFVFWYSNKAKAKEGNYLAGKASGSWKLYHSTGRR
ncbi:toxin-antitoxin system YwqK family antitoxin, partial [Myxococcota bacterium]